MTVLVSPVSLNRTKLLISLAVVAAASWACGPLGPLSGRGLSDPILEAPVADWSVVDAVKIVQLETNPDAPYSVNIWLTRVNRGIDVFQAGDESQWLGNVATDGRVRLRVGGKVYERRAIEVPDLETKHAFLTALKMKYKGDLGYDADFWQRGWETGAFSFFQLDPQ